MKKVFLVFLCVTLIIPLTLVGCGDEKAGNSDSLSKVGNAKENAEETNQISILYWKNNFSPGNSTSFLRSKAEAFSENTGTNVEFIEITASDREDYESKRISRLLKKDGPTLILSMYDTGNRDFVLIRKGIAMKIDDKIPNYQNIYNGLKNDYYVPVKIHVYTTNLRKDIFEKLNIDIPAYDWTSKEYYDIYYKWIQKSELPLLVDFSIVNSIYNYLRYTKYDNLRIVDKETQEVDLNNEQVISFIKELRENILSDSSNILLDKYYSQENYYNMFFERNSEESKTGWDNYMANGEERFFYYDGGHGYNGLNSLYCKKAYDDAKYDTSLIPSYSSRYSTMGFYVNKKGENLQKGYEFLNFLLSDESQLEIFRDEALMIDSHNAPVSKAIETEIEKLEAENSVPEEAKSLRKFFVKKFEEEEILTDVSEPEVDPKRLSYVKNEFYKFVIKQVFADEPLSDRKLSQKLKNLENELYIYLNE